MSLIALLASQQATVTPTPDPSDVDPYTAVVGTRGRYNRVAVTTDANTATRTDYTRHTCIGKTTALQFYWQNSTPNGAIANAVTRSATIVQSDGTRTPVTFGGASEGVMPSGGWLVSDMVALPAPIAQGQTFHLETRSTVAAGEVIGAASGDTVDASRGEYVAYADGIKLTTALTVFPQVIAGQTVTAGVTSQATLGDSIMEGARDLFWKSSIPSGSEGTGGYGDRLAVKLGRTWGNFARGGDSARAMATDAKRVQRYGDTLPLFDQIITDYGTNDWYVAASLADMQSYIVPLWTWIAARKKPGATLRACTITPYASTTAPTHPTREPIRTGYNDWLRDGAPLIGGAPAPAGTTDTSAVRAGQGGHPLTGYYEVADIVESARNSGMWAKSADGVRYDSDGLHPSSLGYQVIADALAGQTE